MGFATSARVLATGAAWRLTGAGWAGRSLVDAFTMGDDDERTIAGMSLVQAGDRSVPLLLDAAASGSDPADIVDVICSIGTDEARVALTRLAGSEDPRTAGPAGDALEDFDEIRRRNA